MKSRVQTVMNGLGIAALVLVVLTEVLTATGEIPAFRTSATRECRTDGVARRIDCGLLKRIRARPEYFAGMQPRPNATTICQFSLKLTWLFGVQIGPDRKTIRCTEPAVMLSPESDPGWSF